MGPRQYSGFPSFWTVMIRRGWLRQPVNRDDFDPSREFFFMRVFAVLLISKNPDTSREAASRFEQSFVEWSFDVLLHGCDYIGNSTPLCRSTRRTRIGSSLCVESSLRTSLDRLLVRIVFIALPRFGRFFSVRGGLPRECLRHSLNTFFGWCLRGGAGLRIRPRSFFCMSGCPSPWFWI